MQELKAARAKNAELTTAIGIQEQQIAEMKPKASYYDVVIAAVLGKSREGEGVRPGVVRFIVIGLVGMVKNWLEPFMQCLSPLLLLMIEEKKHGIAKIDYATIDNPFAGRVICGHCGSPFGRKVWNSTDVRFRRIVWRCNKKYSTKGEKGCENKHVDDDVLYQAFINTFNAIVENKNFFIQKWQQKKDSEDFLEKYKAQQFVEIITGADLIKGFDMDLYFKLIEKMMVFEGDKILVSLLDGTDIECQVE